MTDGKEIKIKVEPITAKIEGMGVSDFLKDDFRVGILDKFKERGDTLFRAMMISITKESEEEVKENEEKYEGVFIGTKSDDEAKNNVLTIITENPETLEAILDLIKEQYLGS